MSLATVDLSRSELAPEETASAWVYVRHELLYLSYALQEVALVSPLALATMTWARYWSPLLVTLWLLLLMLLPFNLLRLLSLLHVSASRQRLVMVIGLLLAVLFSWRLLLFAPTSLVDMSWVGQFLNNLGEGGNLLWSRDLTIFAFTVFMWWRGIRLAGRRHEINRAGLRLRLGGLILAPLLIWAASIFLDINVVPFVMLFFVSSLTSIALVRAEQIEADRTGYASTLGVSWFVAVFGAALLVAILGGLVAAFVSGESLFSVLSIFSPLWSALQFGGTVVLVTLFDLLSPLLDLFALFITALADFMAWLLSLVSNGMQQALPQAPVEGPLAPTPDAPLAGDESSSSARVLAAAALLAVIILAGWAVARVYQQANFATRNSTRSTRLGMVGEEEPSFAERLLGRLGLRRNWRAAASVRRIYEAMCNSAAAAGYPRLETETPYEFLTTLAMVWPDQTTQSRLITEAFIRVRYGEIPESDEELEAIRMAWQILQETPPKQLVAQDASLPRLEKIE